MKKKSDDINTLEYEPAFCILEKAVNLLESGESSLDEALSGYEEGMRAAQRCLELLGTAELKANMLAEELEGKLRLKPLQLKEE